MPTPLARPKTAAPSIRRQTRVDIDAVARRLLDEFASSIGGGLVLAEVFRTREQLVAQGVRAGLAPATEAAARVRLRCRRDDVEAAGSTNNHVIE